MYNCLLGQLSPGQLYPQSKLALLLVELYKMVRPYLSFFPFKSELKWLSYVENANWSVRTHARTHKSEIVSCLTTKNHFSILF